MILVLQQLDFDNLENNADAALITKQVAAFADDKDNTAHTKLNAFLRGIPPLLYYLGHDRAVYPQLVVQVFP